MKTIPFLFATAVLLAACSTPTPAPTAPLSTTAPTASAPTPATKTKAPLAASFSIAPAHKDLVYAGTQKLDLFIPTTGSGPFPLVINIHGGGFRAGSKAMIDDSWGKPMLAAGYAIASIDYRLSGEARFPAAVQDAKAAVRFLRANATKYNLNPDKFAAFGQSAGGNLASLLGTTGDIAEFDDPALGNPGISSRVQAVIDWFGPTDFLRQDAQAKAQGCGASDQTHNAADSPESAYLGAAIQTVPDLRLPRRNGLDVLRIVRADRSLFKTTVLILTAQSDDDDKVAGLELGADDYVTKPFNPREVVARLRAQLRKMRSGALDEPPSVVVRGAFRIDVQAHTATQAGHTLDLTPTEFALLQALMQTPGHVLTRDDLIERCLGYNYQGLGRALDTHMRNLRKKLIASGADADPVATVYGVGYRWQGGE